MSDLLVDFPFVAGNIYQIELFFTTGQAAYFRKIRAFCLEWYTKLMIDEEFQM